MGVKKIEAIRRLFEVKARELSGDDRARMEDRLEHLEELRAAAIEREIRRRVAKALEGVIDRGEADMDNRTHALILRAKQGEEHGAEALARRLDDVARIEAEAVEMAFGDDLKAAGVNHMVEALACQLLKDGKVKPSVGDNGELVYDRAAFRETVEDLKRDPAYQPLFTGKAAQGAQDTGKNPFTKEHFNLTEQGKLYRENPDLAKRMAMEAGVKLYGTGGAGSKPNVSGGKFRNPFAKETFNLTEQGKLYRENPDLAKQLATEAGIKLYGTN